MRSSFFFGFFPSGRTADGRAAKFAAKRISHICSPYRGRTRRRDPPLCEKGDCIGKRRYLSRKNFLGKTFSKRLSRKTFSENFLGKTFSEKLSRKTFSEKLSRKSFRKARTLLFDLFSCEMFALTSGGSAYRRRQHQYLHPARVYAPAKQENPASEKAAARGYPCGGRSCRSVSFSRGSARRRRPDTYRRSARAGPSGRARAASGWRCPFPRPCRIQSRP